MFNFALLSFHEYMKEEHISLFSQKAEWFRMHFSGLPHHKHGAKNRCAGVGKNTYFFDQLLIPQFFISLWHNF